MTLSPCSPRRSPPSHAISTIKGTDDNYGIAMRARGVQAESLLSISRAPLSDGFGPLVQGVHRQGYVQEQNPEGDAKRAEETTGSHPFIHLGNASIYEYGG
ncbi:hypothetical protein CIHG_04238 [Coccidioides immitis H538.4]|uniref:Uncharacterized protein n=3 Tax=Coccidioides immitis TaxID=5501 RepID=A0A0J8TW60_COCIT|nr:hypothetical protein CIRG_04627 [Coccidioides immitis RMSCC 2394]KMU78142.1 hypothetical protein CISG_06983 [Coccidioides immitis RMSCC 3703]KMU86449.1 hypothetical protein CIHG_04238 [Coccidioides immitis H538.4]